MQLLPEMGMPPVWSAYFSVKSIEEIAAKIEPLGGKIIVPITSAGSTGRFVLFADPQGAMCYIIQTSAPQPWSE